MRRLPLLSALALVGAPSLACAQEMEAPRPRLALVQSYSDDDLLGDLPGVAGSITIPTRWKFGVRLGFEWLGVGRDTVAATCVGFIPPGCLPEPSRHRLRLYSGTLGVAKSVRAGDRLSISIVPALRLASADVRFVGRESGRRVGGGSGLVGPEIGAELDIAPVRRWPIAISVAPRVATFLGRESTVMDGFEPFREGFTLGRVEIGVAWRASR